MKETELRPGDYVKVLIDPNTNKQEIGKVTGYNGALLFQIDGFSWVHICRLAPIPLTPEILEKNGCEEDIDKYGYTYYQHNGWYRLSRSEQEDSWVFSHYDDFLTTIQSVHELQHLLWALGVDDDLKI